MSSKNMREKLRIFGFEKRKVIPIIWKFILFCGLALMVIGMGQLLYGNICLYVAITLTGLFVVFISFVIDLYHW